MLSRTVTVGAKYAAQLFLTFLVGLCVLLSVFLFQAIMGNDYVVIAWIVVGYSMFGAVVALICLIRIQNVWEQVQDDLKHVRNLTKLALNASYGKFPRR